MAESTEKNRAKRVLDQAERHLEQALHDCQLLTKKNQKAKKLTITETVRDPITGRKKSKYSYRPRFINRELKNHGDDFVDYHQKWDTVHCASAVNKFRRRGVVVAFVASVSNRVIARKLERKRKKKVEEGGGGEKRKRLPANPTILKNAPWYFTVRLVCKLTARQNRSITNRLPLDCQTCKITLFSNRTRSRRLRKL